MRYCSGKGNILAGGTLLEQLSRRLRYNRGYYVQNINDILSCGFTCPRQGIKTKNSFLSTKPIEVKENEKYTKGSGKPIID